MKYSAAQPSVDILLSTYNGEKYLNDLLLSLTKQTYTNWRLLIRDDGSSDATLFLIESFEKLHSGKVRLIRDDLGNLGPSQSFNKLLMYSNAPFISFCDQDDFWEPDKLKIQITRMLETEERFGRNMPVLVHGDLTVCDDNLKVVYNSFWEFQHIYPEKMKDIKCLLIQNFVTGCTMMINRKLANVAGPIPENALMFDWWFALVSQLKGTIISIKSPIVKYRQHGKNTVGAQKNGILSSIKRVSAEKYSPKKALYNTGMQAQALLASLNGLTLNQKELIQRYCSLFDMPWLQRKREYLRLGIKKSGAFRQIATVLIL